MSLEIKWTDTDPERDSDASCAPSASRAHGASAGNCSGAGEWTRGLEPTLAMWEHVLDSLKRRYRRREGVSDEDVDQVERIVKDLRRQRDEEE